MREREKKNDKGYFFSCWEEGILYRGGEGIFFSWLDLKCNATTDLVGHSQDVMFCSLSVLIMNFDSVYNMYVCNVCMFLYMFLRACTPIATRVKVVG